MSLQKVTKLRDTRATGTEFYELILEAWEGVVTENDSEVHLVTTAQASQWRGFKKSFTERLIAEVDSYAASGKWNEGNLSALSNEILGAQHKSGSELLVEKSASISAKVEAAEAQKVAKGFLGRLKKLF